MIIEPADRGRDPDRRSRAIFGDRLRAVVAYGPQLDGDASAPLTCLALVSSLSLADLEALRHAARRAGRARASPRRSSCPRTSSAGRSTRFRSNTARSSARTPTLYGDNPFATRRHRDGGPAARLRDAGQEPPRAPARGVHRVARHARRPSASWCGRRRRRLPRCCGTSRASPTSIHVIARTPRVRAPDRRPRRTASSRRSWRSSGRPARRRPIRRASFRSIWRPWSSWRARSTRGRAWRATDASEATRHRTLCARVAPCWRSSRRRASCAGRSVRRAAGRAPRAHAAGQRLRRRHRSGERTGARRAHPLAAAGERRRRRRGHGADVQALRRHPRVRREDVREPRPRHRPEGQATTACSCCWPSTTAGCGSRSGYDLEQFITDGFAGETSREFMAPRVPEGRLRTRAWWPASRASSAASPKGGTSSLQGVPAPPPRPVSGASDSGGGIVLLDCSCCSSC